MFHVSVPPRVDNTLLLPEWTLLSGALPCCVLLLCAAAQVYGWLGVEPPRGVLLHGPPGCGKTALAHAIATECGVPFLRVSAPEVVSGMSGESEARLRQLFQVGGGGGGWAAAAGGTALQRVQPALNRRLHHSLLAALYGVCWLPALVVGP
jgi:hypothetical protein